MKEHLREIRGLRQRLEDSIQTNERLRQQLEERLAHTASNKGPSPLVCLLLLASGLLLTLPSPSRCSYQHLHPGSGLGQAAEGGEHQPAEPADR